MNKYFVSYSFWSSGDMRIELQIDAMGEDNKMRKLLKQRRSTLLSV